MNIKSLFEQLANISQLKHQLNIKVSQLPLWCCCKSICCCFLITGSDVTELLSGVRSTQLLFDDDDGLREPLELRASDFLDLVDCSLSDSSFFTACGLSAPNLDDDDTRRLWEPEEDPLAAAAAACCRINRRWRWCSDEADELALLSADGVGLVLRLSRIWIH